MARIGAGLVAPPLCACCARADTAGELVCACCLRELRAESPIRTALPRVEMALAALEYRGAGRDLVQALKFRRRLGLARMAAELILRACPEEELRGAVVPVPAAPWRWCWRGFDPAEEIALALAERAGLPYSACLQRVGGPRQVGRSRARRLADPPVVRARGAAPREVLLVDDVQTTGATLVACAAALRTAGAGRVVALTLARSP